MTSFKLPPDPDTQTKEEKEACELFLRSLEEAGLTEEEWIELVGYKAPKPLPKEARK